MCAQLTANTNVLLKPKWCARICVWCKMHTNKKDEMKHSTHVNTVPVLFFFISNMLNQFSCQSINWNGISQPLLKKSPPPTLYWRRQTLPLRPARLMGSPKLIMTSVTVSAALLGKGSVSFLCINPCCLPRKSSQLKWTTLIKYKECRYNSKSTIKLPD